MKKKIFAFTLTLALLCALVLPALPVSAGPPDRIPPGQFERLEPGWQRLNPHTKSHVIGTEIIGGKRHAIVEAEISSLPTTLDDNVTLIDTSWYMQTDISGQSWFQNGINTFTARVLNGRVSVEDEDGHLAIWSPLVSIGGETFSGGTPKIVDDPTNPDYKGNCLKWEYGSYSTGWFSSSELTRYLRVIEDYISELWILSGDPKASVVVRLNETSELNYDANITWLAAYDADYTPLRVTKNKFGNYVISASEFKNKEFPITIDPEIQDFTGSSYDAWLYAYNATYMTAHNASSATLVLDGDYPAWIGQELYTGNYWIERSSVVFNTAGLDNDLIVDSAYLYLRGFMDNSDTDFYICATSGMPTYPHTPAETADFNRTYYDGSGTAGYYTGSGWSTYAYNVVTVNHEEWINLTGYTKFMLFSDREYNGIAPSGDERVSFWQREHGSTTAPLLRVIGHIPVEPPAVSTLTATSIESTNATLEGRLTDDGGEPCSVWFQYGTDTSYGSLTFPEENKSTGYYFDKPIYGLTPGITYHFIAMAMNNEGTRSGSDKTFTTPPNAPNNFTATAGDSTVALTWNKGSGANKTMIRRSTSSCPTSPSAGTQIYFDTGTSHDDNTVSNGTTYYYSAWSEKSGVYSTTYVKDSATPSGPSVGTVTTNAASPVGVSTAKLWLNVDDLGGSAHVHVKFQYYYGAGEWTDNETALSGEEGLGLYDDDIDTLETSTLYHVRAVIINDTGINEGDDYPFTTGAICAPTITTQSASVLQLYSAILNGTVTDDGGEACIVWFERGLTTDYEEGPTEYDAYYSTGQGFSIGLPNLEPSTTYHYRAVGENVEGGINYGDDVSFETTTPTAPTVRTDAADASANQAMLNATVLTDGSVECEVQFQWGLTDAYGEDTEWIEGYTKDQTFNKLISGLTIDETYHFRAQVKNAGGTGDGDDATFTTVFSAPTNFRAKAISSTTINLEWTKQGDLTYVRGKVGGFPIDRADGFLVYNGPGEFTSISGLTAGVTVYFRAWSWREGDVWADGYADDVATTQAAVPTGEEERPTVLEEPPMPETWFQTPSGAAITKMPFYAPLTDLAGDYEIPEGSFWLVIALVLTIVITTAVLGYSHSAFVTIVVGVLAMSAFSGLGMAPMWFIIVYVALGGGMIYVTSRM